MDTAPAPDAAWLAPLATWAAAQPLLATMAFTIGLALVAWLAFLVTRRYLVAALDRLGRRFQLAWQEALHKQGFFQRLAWVVPLIIVRAGLPYLPLLPDGLATLLQRLIAVGVLLVTAGAIGAFLGAVGDVYARSARAAVRPIKGYLQAIVLVVYVLVAIVVVATLIGRDPLLILGGVGAASAVLLLVFRETLLSLVAGIQLTTNDLIRVGDWIEMPQFHADGDVVEIALNTVKVQNWDRTFTVIPAHKFLDQSFKNWRAMHEAGGRRIKRSILLDMTTVRFMSEQEIDELSRFALLRGYLGNKREELAAWTTSHPEAAEDPVNARRLTNVGTFRAYVTAYLRARPDIRDDMTFLVRQLDPRSDGLPLEIYVFVGDTRWAIYEGVQADVFDHLLAILPEFGLRVFQSPSGADFARLG